MSRSIFLTRGAPGSGKSTWLYNNGAERYTISVDAIRALFASPKVADDGVFRTNHKFESEVWDMVWKAVERRMNQGETIFIDACFSKETDFADVKKLAEVYRYRVYVLDFTHLDKIAVAMQNDNRFSNPYDGRVVEKEVLSKMWARFEGQKPPKYCKVLKATDDEGDLADALPNTFDMNKYKRIHIFGDIQGTSKPLIEYFEKNPFSDDEMYIFCGDLFDRGPDPVGVFNFMEPLVQKKNVLVLTSNHGHWFHMWAMEKDENILSPQFKRTAEQFVLVGITRERARAFVRMEGQFALFDYRGKKYLVTHGGIVVPKLHPMNCKEGIIQDTLFWMPTSQLQKGCGGYGAVKNVCDEWAARTPDEFYQVFGHRSNEGEPVEYNRCFRLEGGVEFGGHLHILQLSEGNHNVVSIHGGTKGHARSEEIDIKPTSEKGEINTVEDLIVAMRSNKGIYERLNGDISSFNFKKEVFHSGNWDDTNIMARGFFVKTAGCEKPYIVCRSYEKFWNLNERPETHIAAVKSDVKYPVSVFRKENGFLGILGLDNEKDELIFCSKSVVGGDFSNYFKVIFEKTLSTKTDFIKNIIRKTNRNLVFEVIDPINDPHIIEYPEAKLVLLDAVLRDIKFDTMPYMDLVCIGEEIGCEVKFQNGLCQDEQQLLSAITAAEDSNTEGAVFIDSNGFMFKVKAKGYKHWKKMRSVVDRMANGKPVELSKLYTEDENKFYSWLRNKERDMGTDNFRNWLRSTNIIALRKQFPN